MVKIVKSGEQPRKETPAEKKMREYKDHKKRLAKLEQEGLLEEFIDNHKCGRDIAKTAKVNQIGTPRETPPHTVDQLKAGCKSYFKMIESKTETKITKDGDVVDVPKAYPMTLEGLCKHLGISYYWWNRYENGEGMEKYHETAQAAKMTIVANILEGGLNNDFNANLSKFYLQNITKLRDNPDHKDTSGIKNLTFITVNNKEELAQLDDAMDAQLIEDAEIIEDGTQDTDE